MKIVSTGVDLSLTGTGVVTLEDGKLIREYLIKSKPRGDKPVDEVDRLYEILCEVLIEIGRFDRITGKAGGIPDIVVIENLAFMAKGTSLTQLAGLSHLLRNELRIMEIPFLMVAPTTLKKFVTGNGAAKKDVIMMEIFKRYGVTMLDDNKADAYGLAQIGLAVLGGNSKSTTKTQDEVIDLIKKQL